MEVIDVCPKVFETMISCVCEGFLRFRRKRSLTYSTEFILAYLAEYMSMPDWEGSGF